MYRAHQASACPTAMMTLTSDWTALNSKIDAMTPTGNTNVTIGLQIGWQTLSPVAPFNARRAGARSRQGHHPADRRRQHPEPLDVELSRRSTRAPQKACDNVKAANIKLYTVRVIDGNATLLQNCATKPEMYYDVQQASQLNSVFSSIAQNLANLRIAK